MTPRCLDAGRRALLPAALGMLAVAVSGCGAGPAPPALPALRARAFEPAAREPCVRGAWKRLRETSSYGWVTNVWTWGPVGPAMDACTLWHAGASDALVQLALGAEPGGRLWAMRALCHLDREAFDELAPCFVGDETIVKTSHGCIADRGSVDRVFREEVVGDHELQRTYDDLFDEDAAASFHDWALRLRGSQYFLLESEAAQAAAERLAAASHVGDATCELAVDVDLLLEEAPFPLYAVSILAVSPEPNARFWGAWALRRLSPPRFAALTSFWEDDRTPVTCRAADGSEEHTLAEAIALRDTAAADQTSMEVRCCRFEPHVLAVARDDTVRFTNEDPAPHQARVQLCSDLTHLERLGWERRPWLTGLLGEGESALAVFPRSGVFEVISQTEEWMQAFVYTARSRLVAVTDASGRFEIPRAPAGALTLRVGHPELGWNLANVPLPLPDRHEVPLDILPTAQHDPSDRRL